MFLSLIQLLLFLLLQFLFLCLFLLQLLPFLLLMFQFLFLFCSRSSRCFCVIMFSF